MKSGNWAIFILILFLASSCFHFKPPRCKIPNCEVRMIHAHGGKEFRGSPWWRTNQNPKVGQRYKKQAADPPLTK